LRTEGRHPKRKGPIKYEETRESACEVGRYEGNKQPDQKQAQNQEQIAAPIIDGAVTCFGWEIGGHDVQRILEPTM
jgi:hypothetical protein